MRMEKRDTDIYDIGEKVVFTPGSRKKSYPAVVIGYWEEFNFGPCWVEYETSNGTRGRVPATFKEVKKINSIGYGSAGLPTI